MKNYYRQTTVDPSITDDNGQPLQTVLEIDVTSLSDEDKLTAMGVLNGSIDPSEVEGNEHSPLKSAVAQLASQQAAVESSKAVLIGGGHIIPVPPEPVNPPVVTYHRHQCDHDEPAKHGCQLIEIDPDTGLDL